MTGLRSTIIIVAALAGSTGAPAGAHAVDRPYLAVGAEIGAPRGFVEMCGRDTTFCTPKAGGGRAAPDERFDLLRKVNRFVNTRVAQRTDERNYGQAELWRRSGVGRGASGDCEDIAIEKRHELVGAGFPPDSLYFAVVYERQIGLHAVLVARARDGDFVLDSRSPHVDRWDRTAYTFVAVQSTREPMRWFAPSRGPAEVMAGLSRRAGGDHATG